MMRAIVLLAILSGCAPERPRALVMCHNSHCAGTDPARDDTLEAFRESLALEYQGRGTIDGIEIDLIFDPRDGRCVFEHDHADTATAPESRAVAAELADHLRARGERAAYNGERFLLKLELKSGAAPDGGLLTPSMMYGLADCALADAAVVEAAVAEAGLESTVFFESSDPLLLAALLERPGWDPALAGRRAPRQLAVNHTARVGDLLEPLVGVVAVSWKDARDGSRETYRDLAGAGVDVMMWMFDATEEVFGAITLVSPTYVNTNEAPLFRQWLSPL